MTKPKIIRALPNTPVQASVGIIAFVPGRYVTPSDVVEVKTLFNALGMVRKIPENLMNPLTSLNSCGTASVTLFIAHLTHINLIRTCECKCFFFLQAYNIINAMADCMHAQDVPVSMAFKLAAEMVAGSARMVLESNKHPAILRDEVNMRLKRLEQEH